MRAKKIDEHVEQAVRNDILKFKENIQMLLNDMTSKGDCVGGEVLLDMDPDNRHAYTFKVVINPSHPIDMTKFFYLLGIQKLREI